MVNQLGVLRKEHLDELKHFREKYEHFHDRDIQILILEEQKKTNLLLSKLVAEKNLKKNDTITIKTAMDEFGVGRGKITALYESGYFTKQIGHGKNSILLLHSECVSLRKRGLL